MSQENQTAIAPVDGLRLVSVPDYSPSLSVLRQLTANKESFTLKHEAMECPALPPKPEKVQSGKRAHMITTLTDLTEYIKHIIPPKPIGFYSAEGVSVVLDEDDDEEKEIIKCNLERHPQFEAWEEVLGGKQMTQPEFVNFLRAHSDAVDKVNPGSSVVLIGSYSCLTGTLVHGADEFLDTQSRSATFTVKRKKPGGQETEQQIEDVPTEFTIAMPILADDENPTPFTVMVRMTGDNGAAIRFTCIVRNMQEIIDQHIDNRLRAFASSAGFLCVRGSFNEQPWQQPQLPTSVKEPLTLQKDLIAAMASRK